MTPHQTSISHVDKSNMLIVQLSKHIEANLENEQFSVERLAEHMNMSRCNLYRKIKHSTGLSINQFIKVYRLKRALELLKQEELTIAEISYRVGFGSPAYFNKCFKEYYGHSPGIKRKKITLKIRNHNPTWLSHFVKCRDYIRQWVITYVIF